MNLAKFTSYFLFLNAGKFCHAELVSASYHNKNQI